MVPEDQQPTTLFFDGVEVARATERKSTGML